ncbi:MAG TPA: mechanosensitive ion channel family protein [Terriglobales bacterium]|nr:mechanosensitive ion channel family protein [Terriglobales bacterium]
MNPLCDLFVLFVDLETENIPGLLHAWRVDTMTFLRHDLPKLLLVLLGAFVLMRVLRAVTGKLADLREQRFAQVRAQQIRTLAAVINSIGVFVILFVASLQALSLLGLNLGPLLASAGIAGLAIGFGAQTLVKDWINGFFILFEDQFSIGDTVRAAGVRGVVEEMSLRRTVLRDDDGTLHMVPNSQISILSNMTRDWAQFPLRVTVAYSEPSDRIISLLEQIGNEVRHDPAFAEDIVSDIQVPGIDRVGNEEVEYLMLIKTRPNKQWGVSRELRKQIKDCFVKNNVKPGAPGRVYIADPQAKAW